MVNRQVVVQRHRRRQRLSNLAGFIHCGCLENQNRLARCPYEAVYETLSLGSEKTYEAELAVPRDFAQRLFGKAHSYLDPTEDNYDVTTVAASAGSAADDEAFVMLELKGARGTSVECFRAEMRSAVHAVEMARVAPI